MNSKIGKDGRITIPIKVREEKKISPGDIIFYTIEKVVSPDGIEKVRC